MSLTVKFAIDEDECVIAGPVYDSQPVSGPANYVSAVAADGTRYSYRLNSSAWRTWRMTFDLDQVQFGLLSEFFNDVAQGPTSEFTFTSTSGDNYTARFADTSLPWSRLGPARRSVQLTLEVKSEVK